MSEGTMTFAYQDGKVNDPMDHSLMNQVDNYKNGFTVLSTWILMHLVANYDQRWLVIGV
jgi:polyhydroxyalkanoate synthesis regulator protein